MTQQVPYIGSRISLISKSDIRYEGLLYSIDPEQSTVALQGGVSSSCCLLQETHDVVSARVRFRGPERWQ
jgi:hypothetical protein